MKQIRKYETLYSQNDNNGLEKWKLLILCIPTVYLTDLFQYNVQTA